jgi:hypothetical protein
MFACCTCGMSLGCSSRISILLVVVLRAVDEAVVEVPSNFSEGCSLAR